MKYTELDTPSLLIDKAILESNLRFMQDYANAQGVALRPHTKTHKMPAIALMQMELGAEGIAVAKVGEAEVMAEHGLRNILIANEIVGETKLQRIRALAEQGVDIVFGVDCPEQVEVREAEGEQGAVLELSVSHDDLGKIIGKQGRTARAIRTLLGAVSAKTKKRVVLEILE